MDSLFKIIVPEELKGYIPQDFADRNLELFTKRAEILKEYGLKAAFKGCEPGWLVPEVFEAHPEWRGPRFDYTRRSRKPYYSPCIDNPEILAMYRRTVKQLCEIIPIEYMQLLTNDSGGGICWGDGLYPGKNGPLSCKNISFAERISNFLTVLQNGAMDAGVKTNISLRGNFSPNEMKSAIQMLGEGQAIGERAESYSPKTSLYNKTGDISDYYVGYYSDYYQNDVNPVIGIPQPIEFAKECQEAFAAIESKDSNMVVSFQSVEDTLLFDIFKQYKNQKPKTFITRYNLLREAAVNEVGENKADTLIDIWNHIYDFRNTIHPLGCGGHVFLLGCNNQRWLVRPFVMEPEKLTEDETSYYRRFQFQARTEENANDLMDLQATRFISGWSAAYISSHIIMGLALFELNSAIEKFNELISIEKYALLKQRLLVLRCVLHNAQNAIRFQELLDRTDIENPKVDPPTWGYKPEADYYRMQDIMRAEIDNTSELISLLDGQDIHKLLYVADCEENEDVFLMNPNMIPLLKKKIKIMVAHLADIDRIYVQGS